MLFPHHLMPEIMPNPNRVTITRRNQHKWNIKWPVTEAREDAAVVHSDSGCTSLNIVFVVAITGTSCWSDFTYQSFVLKLTQLPFILLANVNYAIARPSSVCRRSVCLSSVMLVFSTIFLRHLARWPSVDIHWKFYGDRHGGTRPPAKLNTRGVAKYSDFGPIEGNILETVQDRR